MDTTRGARVGEREKDNDLAFGMMIAKPLVMNAKYAVNIAITLF